MALLAWKNGDITMVELKKFLSTERSRAEQEGFDNCLKIHGAVFEGEKPEESYLYKKAQAEERSRLLDAFEGIIGEDEPENMSGKMSHLQVKHIQEIMERNALRAEQRQKLQELRGKK